jgi:hypothetical protein
LHIAGVNGLVVFIDEHDDPLARGPVQVPGQIAERAAIQHGLGRAVENGLEVARSPAPGARRIEQAALCSPNRVWIFLVRSAQHCSKLAA